MSLQKEELKAVVTLGAVLLIILAASAYAKSADALHILNHRRASMGLRPYLPAPELQAAAERSAANQAARGRMYHNSHRGARSGVGMHSGNSPGHFKTCYSFARIQPGTRAAAAYAVGRRGTYFALDISGRRGVNAGGTIVAPCPRCGRYH